MTLNEFLLARIAEQKERYRPTGWPLNSGDLNEGYIEGLHEQLRAECERDRRIVELLDDAVIGWDELDVGYSPEDWFAKQIARTMALPYADHPDYDPAWATGA